MHNIAKDVDRRLYRHFNSAVRAMIINSLLYKEMI